MRILFALLVVLLAFLLFSISDEKISKKNKFLLIFGMVIFVAFAYIYEENLSKSQDRNLEILTAFNQGKILICGDMNVTNDKFNYEFGTASFVAKREFKELSSIKAQAKECEIKSDERDN